MNECTCTALRSGKHLPCKYCQETKTLKLIQIPKLTTDFSNNIVLQADTTPFNITPDQTIELRIISAATEQLPERGESSKGNCNQTVAPQICKERTRSNSDPPTSSGRTSPENQERSAAPPLTRWKSEANIAHIYHQIDPNDSEITYHDYQQTQVAPEQQNSILPPARRGIAFSPPEADDESDTLSDDSPSSNTPVSSRTSTPPVPSHLRPSEQLTGISLSTEQLTAYGIYISSPSTPSGPSHLVIPAIPQSSTKNPHQSEISSPRVESPPRIEPPVSGSPRVCISEWWGL